MPARHLDPPGPKLDWIHSVIAKVALRGGFLLCPARGMAASRHHKKGGSMTSHAPKERKGPRIIDLLRPHWKALTLALLAVAGETVTDLLEPWPLKIVLDYLL